MSRGSRGLVAPAALAPAGWISLRGAGQCEDMSSNGRSVAGHGPDPDRRAAERRMKPVSPGDEECKRMRRRPCKLRPVCEFHTHKTITPCQSRTASFAGDGSAAFPGAALRSGPADKSRVSLRPRPTATGIGFRERRRLRLLRPASENERIPCPGMRIAEPTPWRASSGRGMEKPDRCND